MIKFIKMAIPRIEVRAPVTPTTFLTVLSGGYFSLSPATKDILEDLTESKSPSIPKLSFFSLIEVSVSVYFLLVRVEGLLY